jgi:hypothetical protein
MKIMKKILALALLGILFMSFGNAKGYDRTAIMDSLTTIDEEIVKYFPRWKVCETDLQLQVFFTFRTLGYDAELLSKEDIKVLAAPNLQPGFPYNILQIECGEAVANRLDLETNFGQLTRILSGEFSYQTNQRNQQVAERDYCYDDIPSDVPPNHRQSEAIINYLKPNNVTHAFSLSLFEQALKIGSTGFWVSNIVGSEKVGYHFWSSGESKVVLSRPLIPNNDPRTIMGIPNLLDVYIGGAYKINSGLANESTVLSWIKDRQLNGSPGGKIVGGFNLYMPFHPPAGIAFDVELPLNSLTTEAIDEPTFASYESETPIFINNLGPDQEQYPDMAVPIYKNSGQFALFYNWWFDKNNPKNFLRVDFGLNYFEIQEYAIYRDDAKQETFITNEAEGLQLYKPNEFGDWLYLRADYRNQAGWPFGVTMQYSNQMLYGRVYIPLFGDWLYLEGRYSTPLRTPRPYEIEHFFMISPVFRLTL